MVFIGNQPTAVPLTSDQLTDGLITTAKIATGAVENVDIASNTINLTQKVTGTLPFANGGTGLSTLGTAGQALIVNSSATALSYATVGATAGQVIQVVQTIKTGTFSSSSTSLVDITGLSVSITPSASANKILVLFSVEIGQFSSNANCTLQLIRGSTAIYQGDQVGSSRKRGSAQTGPSGVQNSVQSVTGMFLDSPSTTSSTTYKIQGMSNNSATYQVNIDYDGPSNDDTNRTVSVSQITVMEIKG